MRFNPTYISQPASMGILTGNATSNDFLYSLLSKKEQEKYAGIKLAKRKTNWLRGRALAKHLFLNRFEAASNKDQQQWKPGLQALDVNALTTFSPWMYRLVEVIPDLTQAEKISRLWWKGEPVDLQISLSHKSELSAACIDGGTGAIGVDVESRLNGSSTFYKGNFTTNERAWVATFAQAHSIEQDWLFTLLWTIKEATLKTRNTDDVSVFEFPDLEITLLSDPLPLCRAYQNKQLSSGTEFIDIEIKSITHKITAQVALTATSKHVLSVMKSISQEKI